MEVLMFYADNAAR